MAEEFQLGGSGNWWDTTRNRFESGASPSSTTPTNIASFGWPTEIMDNKARSSTDSVSVSGSASSIVFQDSLKLQAPDSSSAAASGVLPDPNLQIMGLALSSQGMDWNQALFRNPKAESSFPSMLQADMSSNASFQQEAEAGMGSGQDHWRKKLYFAGSSGDSSVNEYKQISRAFSLDQPQFSSQISSSDSTVTCQGFPSSYQMDSAVYGSASTVLQGILGSDNQSQQSNFENRYQFPSSYGLNSDETMPYWSKFPQFMRNSPPKQPAPHGQLHFSNNTPFWSASAASMNDIKSGLFPSLQPQFPSPSSFDEKPSKNTSEVRDLGTVSKKNSSEASTKRPRNESPSPLPAFKVRKEKMGDRITALQQLVSPFGKTDTASVLSEAIEYIKFLHEQVNVLSTPYMKSGAAVQQQLQQNSDKSKDGEGPKKDLRSRGLCLVPISSTFPVTHETTVDFWTPTYGGTFR